MIKIFQIPDKDESIQSYMLYMLAMIWTAVTWLIVLVEFYFFPQFWIWWIARIAITLFIAVFNIALDRFGYTRLASWSFTVMLWLSFTVPCYSTGGIMATGILSQMSIILTAGFLLSWRGGLIMGLLTVGVDFGFVYLEMKGLLPQPSIVHDPVMRWISGIIPFGTILATQFFSIQHLRTSLISLQREIVKGREASKALQASEERYRSIITVSNTGAWEYNIRTNRIWYSAQYFSMIGMDRPGGNWDETLEGNWIDRLHPEDRERSAKTFTDFLTGGAVGWYENTFRMRHETGAWVWIWSRGRRLVDAKGSSTNIILGTHIDITEQKEAEAKIEQGAQLLRKITSQVPANTYMFEIQEDGRPNVLFLSRGSDDHSPDFGQKPGSESWNKIQDTIHEDDMPKFLGKMREGRQTLIPLSFQFRIVVNGSIRWRWMKAVPEKDENGKVLWYGATNDITSLVDYITSIEQIIFDISHVIRRPISSMLGMTRLAVDHNPTNEEIKEISIRLHAIAEEMDNFSRELNEAYNQKRKHSQLDLDITSSLDKRMNLFSTGAGKSREE